MPWFNWPFRSILDIIFSLGVKESLCLEVLFLPLKTLWSCGNSFSTFWNCLLFPWTMYQDYTGTYDTSSRGSSSSPAHLDTSPIPASNYQKYRLDMPGSSSAFIPTINAITTSQDLQWMVQPTVITSMSNPYSRPHPYGLSSGPSLLGHSTLTRPGVIRSIGDARGRRKRDEQVSVTFFFFEAQRLNQTNKTSLTYRTKTHFKHLLNYWIMTFF